MTIEAGSGEELLTVEQAAALLQVHPNTIYRLCRSNRLAHTRVGRVYRVHRTALGQLPSAGSDAPTADREAPPPGSHQGQPRVIALANQKGGVGKTTTAVNLGAALAERGLRVLLIDLDAQANATTTLVGRGDIRPGTTEILMDAYPAGECIRPTNVPNLAIIPANISLSNVEVHLLTKNSREHVVRAVVKAVADRFDLVLVDCPPSLGVLTVAGLVAADEYIVPIRPHLYSALGLQQLFATVAELNRSLEEAIGRPGPRLLGVLINQGTLRRDGTPRGGAYQEVLAMVRSEHGAALFATTIPDAVTIEDAIHRRTSVIQSDPRGEISQAYRRLATEVIERAR